MKTTIFYDKSVPAFDADIKERLGLVAVESEIVHGERMRIALRNDEGQIYRAIGIGDEMDFIGAVDCLELLGLHDELEHLDDARHGYDAIFTREA